MRLTLLKSKIHRAIVTDANLEYEGSACAPGDRVIICPYAECEEAEAVRHQPALVFVDDQNRCQ